MTPEVKVGDYIIMHAGFAIQILDTREAEKTLRLLEEIAASEPGTVRIDDG
jgi:hydrogenase expression/formation protein HypC